MAEKPTPNPWAAWQQAGTLPDSLSDVPGASKGDAAWTVDPDGQHVEAPQP